MLIRSFKSRTEKPVKFIPVSINYEKVLEGNSYLSELMGGKKRKERISDIFRVASDFRGFLGNAYLQFGDPIDLKDFLDAQNPGWENNDSQTDGSSSDDNAWLFNAYSTLVYVHHDEHKREYCSNLFKSGCSSPFKFK